MEAHLEVTRTSKLDHDLVILMARLAGVVPPGSEGNAPVREIAARIYQEADQLRSRCEAGSNWFAGIVLDCLRLQYVFGDSFASLWLEALKRKTGVVIVARGETRANIESLVRLGLPVPICESEDQAVQILVSGSEDRGDGDLPVFRVSPGTRPIRLEDVKRIEDEG